MVLFCQNFLFPPRDICEATKAAGVFKKKFCFYSVEKIRFLTNLLLIIFKMFHSLYVKRTENVGKRNIRINKLGIMNVSN